MDCDVRPADLSASDSLSSASVPADGASEAEVGSPGPVAEDLETYNLIEPPPLDWRSDSSSEAGSAEDLDEPSFPPSVETLDTAAACEPGSLPLNTSDTLLDVDQQDVAGHAAEPAQLVEAGSEREDGAAEGVRLVDLDDAGEEEERDAESGISEEEAEGADRRSGDEDHSHIHRLLSQLQLMGEEPRPSCRTPPHPAQHQLSSSPEVEHCASSSLLDDSTETTGLLFSESHHRDLLGLLQFTEIGASPRPASLPHGGDVDAVVSVSYSQEDAQRFWERCGNGEEQQQRHRNDSLASLPDEEYPEPVWMKLGEQPPEEDEAAADSEQVGISLCTQDLLS